MKGYSREAWGKGEPAQPSRATSEYLVPRTWLFRLVLPLPGHVLKVHRQGTSPVVQWLKVFCLLMQGMRVQFLVGGTKIPLAIGCGQKVKNNKSPQTVFIKVSATLSELLERPSLAFLYIL